MASVLLTGSSGFLGCALVPRLIDAGHRLIGLDPAPPKLPGYQHVALDLSDAGRLADFLAAHRITHVIHAGGVSGPMLLGDRPDQVMAINVTGSLNLLQAALQSDAKTFLYCSSVSAIGEYYEERPIGDDHPMQPVHPYGASKAAVDMVLRGLWGRVPLDLCSLRFTTIYGPGRQTNWVLDDIVAAAIAGRDVSIPAATDAPYIFIDDAADAVMAACFSDRRRQLAYFIAYPEQVALSDLAAAVAAAGRPVRLVIDETHPPTARGPLDIEPAIRDFGFAPRVDYREGIRRMIAARTVAPG